MTCVTQSSPLHRTAAPAVSGKRRSAWIATTALFPLALLGWAAPSDAGITAVDVSSRTTAFNHASFGSVGEYEILAGVAHGEVDPDDPLNAIITDVALAPRNARGMVEYSMDFSIYKPVDASKGNHTLLYDVVNRGRMLLPGLNIGGSATSAGDGYLENAGYTLVFSGWEGDITSGLRINLPVATNKDGGAITGPVRGEYIFTSPASTEDLSGPPTYEAVSTDNRGATMTQRVHQHDAREVIPNDRWAFADCTSTPFPGVPSTTKVCLNGGFDTNHIYELVYTAKNPTVAGLGFAATRDFISFLRNGNGALTGHGNGVGNGDGRGRCHNRGQGAAHNGCAQPLPVPVDQNPLGASISNAMIYGSSQSGRWIRTFIQLGFNQDETLHQVVEGAMPHIASNRGAFDVRFAQPTRLSGTQHTEAQYPGAESPQTWEVSDDPLSDVNASQLDRCRATNSCPKVIATVTDTEYWQSLMALNTTDALGTRDLPIPGNVRIFQLSSSQHGSGSPLASPTAAPVVPANCQLARNPNPYIPYQRALLQDLHDWVVDGVAPPPSLYSTIADGSLVPVESMQFPYAGGAVNFTPESVANRKFFLDRGAQFDVQDITGVMAEPPIARSAYALLLPQIDADGNDIGGLRGVNIQVPVGTYTGWNPRRAGFSEGDSCDLTGGYIPFFRTKAERQANGDPRLSLEERYTSHADYVAKVTAAANALVAKRLMLPQDAALATSVAQSAIVP
jgi:hypothetical protein